MLSEKKDLITPAKVKKTAAKKRISEPKVEPVSLTGEARIPKKSKLAVRVVGRDFNIIKESEQAKNITAETMAVEAAKKVKKTTKPKPEEKDFFQRASRYLDEAEPAADLKTENKKKSEQKNESRPVGLYRKISLFFIFLTLVLLAAAFYFFLVSLTIEVSSKTERISDKLNIAVSNGGKNQAGAANISGAVEQIPVKERKTYEATGANILGQEIIGRVSIINNYTTDKTLVATTRLLSPDGKLFRIKNKIFIPAGDSTEVEIYTDEPSPEMAIGPATFSIPGLWAGLQDKIYAKSAAAFVYQSDVQKFVQESDLAKARQDIEETLIKKVSKQFGSNYKGFDKVIAQLDKDSLAASSSAKANQKVDKFDFSLSALADIVAWQSADMKKLAESKIVSVISPDEKFAGLKEEETRYNLTGADFKNGAANLEVSFVGAMDLADADSAVDKTKLTGLNSEQIESYLNGLNKFSSIKLIFWPPFINRAPSLVDRIKIVIR
jgi:hypothetical protein